MVLAFGLSWWVWPLVLLNPNSVAMIPYGPIIAVFAVTAVVGGKKGLKELPGSIVRWRVHPGWYAAALLLPAAITVAAVYTNVTLGAAAPSAGALSDWWTILIGFPVTLLIAGPLVEEPGWRGFVLPRLQMKISALAASLMLAVIWLTWHLPLLLSDPTGQRPPAQFFVTVVAQAILLTWIYNGTKGSVFLPVLFHTAANTVTAFFFKMYIGTGEEYQRLWWIYAAVYGLVAVGVVAAAGAEYPGRRKQAPAVKAVAEPA
jgi:membrane protease YdiL (CAAX protease family)